MVFTPVSTTVLFFSDRRCLAQSFTYTGAMAITSFSAKPEGMSHLLSVSL